jgi:hypothetical protein
MRVRVQRRLLSHRDRDLGVGVQVFGMSLTGIKSPFVVSLSNPDLISEILMCRKHRKRLNGFVLFQS